MTLLEHLARQARLPRAGFFAAWGLMAVAMLWKPDSAMSRTMLAVSIALFPASLLMAYREVRCPRCRARLWRIGMGMVPPRIGAAPQPLSCPGCGLLYDAQIDDSEQGTTPPP